MNGRASANKKVPVTSPFSPHTDRTRRRDTQEPAILAGIQSIYQRVCEPVAFDLVLVAEAHLITSEGKAV